MSSKKLTKEDLRTPDFFVSHGHQVAEFLLKYRQFFLSVLVAVLAASVVWLGMSYWQSHREGGAASQLYPMEKRIQTDFEKTKTISDGDLSDYERVFNENSSTRSALVSLIALSTDLINGGKAATGLAWFSKLGYRPADSDVYFGLMKMTEGLLAMEAQKPDQALEFYQAVLSAPLQKSFHADAALKSGVAYQVKNDIPKAREMYEKVRRDYPSTPAGELAFQYLLYLESKKGV